MINQPASQPVADTQLVDTATRSLSQNQLDDGAREQLVSAPTAASILMRGYPFQGATCIDSIDQTAPCGMRSRSDMSFCSERSQQRNTINLHLPSEPSRPNAATLRNSVG